MDSGQYRAENLFKLHQRLAKAQESLQNYELAADNYEKVIESTDLSKMSNIWFHLNLFPQTNKNC